MQLINIPDTCPSCAYKLELVNMQLYCRNTSCPARIDKLIEHFCKTLSIKGIGAKTVEKLNLQDITELFYLDRDDLISVLGEKTSDKLLDEISRAKTASLDVVLAAFGIPLVGITASTKIANTVSSIDEINQETCKMAGLGAKVTENLLNWISTDYQEMKEFLPFTFKSIKKESIHTNRKKVCITGKLFSYKKKADAEQVLLAAGFELVNSVTKTTDYLVDESDEFEEGFKPSEKRKKAISYGITIITDLNDLTKEK